MRSIRIFSVLLTTIVLLLLLIAACTVAPASPTPEAPVTGDASISGMVFDADGPVQDAVVRIQNTKLEDVTDSKGRFTISGVTASRPLSVTAWSLGYYGGAANATGGDDDVLIELLRYHTTDNVDYEFASAEKCAECHMAYPEWREDAHALSAQNPRFLTMYTGEDVSGNKPEVKRDAAGLPLPPEPGDAYYGPGVHVDYPDRAGNCAACHTPAAAGLETTNTCGWSGCHSSYTTQMSEQVPYGVSPSGLRGVANEGMNCDFCHKIGNVILDEETGLPFSARPGVMSMQIFRPAEGEDLFLGPFDDVPGHDSYLPLQQESAFCAPCHHGVFDGVAGSHNMTGGVVIYDSYGEWLDSPFSDPNEGKTCQRCHMPRVDYDHFVFPDKGGLARGAHRIRNHRMTGASDELLLENALSLSSVVQKADGQIQVDVSVKNDKTGHHVPTGTPLRQVFLVVTAADADGQPLPLIAGDTLPGWAGDLAGKPGRYYAKILRDEWTGETPTGAYWRNIELVEDTRLPAMAADAGSFTFAAPDSGSATIETNLIYRRAFQKLAEQKGWSDPDILMESETLVVE